MNNSTTTNELANTTPSNPWAIMCCGKRIELGAELLSEANDFLTSGEVKAVSCFIRDDQFSNGVEYLIGMVVAGQADQNGWPHGWDCLVEGNASGEFEWHDPSYLRLKNAPSDYAFKKVVLCLADAHNNCSTLIEIAVAQNMMEGFQDDAPDLIETVLDHIREFASYELGPVLVTKLVITPAELTQASTAKRNAEEPCH